MLGCLALYSRAPSLIGGGLFFFSFLKNYQLSLVYHFHGGEGGIRTHGDLRHIGFQDRRTRPTMRPLQTARYYLILAKNSIDLLKRINFVVY